MVSVGDVLEGQGESLELALRDAWAKKLPPLGGTIPSGIKSEVLTCHTLTTGFGHLIQIRLRIIGVPREV